jgi:enoyl-CoA hydratase/carnithine racemase
MSEEEIVRLEHDGTVGLVTLNRPESMNAINLEMRRILADTIRAAEGDDSIRAIVIRGAGTRAFCAGADVKEFKAADSLNAARVLRDPPGWNDLIAACRKPTIAAVQGVCLGGGLEMALACDMRIASAEAVFGLPEVRLAIIPGAGGTQRLPRVVGMGHALRLILTGDRVDADEALRIGLVSEIVPHEELVQRAVELARTISEGGPLAIGYAKEAVRRGFDMSIADGLRLEADLATLLTNTADRLEGAAAFRERRKPVYRGE